MPQIDRLLRGGSNADDPISISASFWHLVVCVVVFGGSYGLVMGAFSGFTGDHGLQLLFSCIKAPLLLLFSFVVSLPSFFVLNSLCGLRRDFGEALKALAATQAGLTVILASFAPFTAVWYLSSDNYQSAVAFNGVMFAAASVSSQFLLRRYYGPLIRRDSRHRWMLTGWLVVYCFVGIQLAWVLRPFIGDPSSPPQFLRSDVFRENAYEVVFRLACHMLIGN